METNLFRYFFQLEPDHTRNKHDNGRGLCRKPFLFVLGKVGITDDWNYTADVNLHTCLPSFPFSFPTPDWHLGVKVVGKVITVLNASGWIFILLLVSRRPLHETSWHPLPHGLALQLLLSASCNQCQVIGAQGQSKFIAHLQLNLCQMMIVDIHGPDSTTSFRPSLCCLSSWAWPGGVGLAKVYMRTQHRKDIRTQSLMAEGSLRPWTRMQGLQMQVYKLLHYNYELWQSSCLEVHQRWLTDWWCHTNQYLMHACSLGTWTFELVSIVILSSDYSQNNTAAIPLRFCLEHTYLCWHPKIGVSFTTRSLKIGYGSFSLVFLRKKTM